ncbi:hypothetical protein TNCV_1885461 [Trichonephila clavipes]|nr:hypothetical protein TNCV_1885461 [Trichonephila clavipes]
MIHPTIKLDLRVGPRGILDESRLCVLNHDERIRIWRHQGERIWRACYSISSYGPFSRCKVWKGLSFVLVVRNLNRQRYISARIQVACRILTFLDAEAVRLPS